MLSSLRKSFSSLSDLQICQAIASGKISNNWLIKEDVTLAATATEDNAKEVLDKIDANRNHAYSFWQMFN